ncbi:MAG: hypothetical protein IIB39_08840 [Candidatus Marinimicrobia bacterium]|nr:hypothetical protein [Candidatus Neomarinimicrobiota bacterium]
MDNIVDELKKNELPDFLSDREKSIVKYVLKITKTPSEMRKDDVEELKNAGLSEAAVLNLVLVAGYFAFVNRLADGLGIDLEDYRKR